MSLTDEQRAVADYERDHFDTPAAWRRYTDVKHAAPGSEWGLMHEARYLQVLRQVMDHPDTPAEYGQEFVDALRERANRKRHRREALRDGRVRNVGGRWETL